MKPVLTNQTYDGSGVKLVADRWDPPALDNRGARLDHKGVVLLLHGGGQTRHSWRNTGHRLALDGWAAIAVDARGHGESQWAPEGDYNLDALIADLVSIVEGLEAKPVLVGASMGGMTSLIAQAENPDLARGLVLVDIAPKVESDGTAEVISFMSRGLEGFASLEDAAAAVAEYTPSRDRKPNPQGLRKNLRFRNGRWYWHWDPAFIDNGDGSSRDLETITHYDRAREAAALITVPTMLVRGKQSNVVSEEGANELLELIPTATLLDVRGAGHMVVGDDNDIFGGGLQAFLNEAVTL